jgi:quercetin dioxygenase-like cupin family protein
MHDREAWMQTLTGARIRIKTAGNDTGNRLTIIDFVEPPNSEPPVFTRHEFVEVFCVVSGKLCFQFIDEPGFTLAAGQSVTCPSFKPHSFWNEKNEPAVVQLVCSPAGLDDFFIAADALLKETTTDAAALDKKRQALRSQYGLEHVGSPPMRLGN